MLSFISSLPAEVRKYLKIAGKGESSLRVGNVPPAHRSTLISARSTSSGHVRRLAVDKSTVPGKVLYRSQSHPPSESKSALEAPIPKRQASYHMPNGSSKPPVTKRLRTDQSRLARPVTSQTTHSDTPLAGPNVTLDQPPPTEQGTPINKSETNSHPSIDSPKRDQMLIKKENNHPKHSDQQSNTHPIPRTPSISSRVPSSFRRSRSSLLSSARRSLGDPVRPVKLYQVGQGKDISHHYCQLHGIDMVHF
jgi:hypothetical protein